MQIVQGLRKGDAHFSGLHKTVMHIVEALIQRSCIFYGLHAIVVHNFEALTMGSNAHKAKWTNHACHMQNL